MKNLKIPILIIVFTIVFTISMLVAFMYVQKNKKTKYPAKTYEIKYIVEKNDKVKEFF